MRLTKKLHEESLNELYDPETAMEIGAYMPKAKRLLSQGKYGTALRKYDPIAFEVSYRDLVGY